MFMPPMLLETATEPFNDSNTIFEPKIDGHRMIYSHVQNRTQLYTRHQNECTTKYPELLTGIQEDIVLDGEVAQVDPHTGEISLESLNERFQMQRTDKIIAASKAWPCSFIAWDILRYRGIDLRNLPLLQRKDLLSQITINNSNISIIPFVENEGLKLFQTIRDKGWEGVVSKEKNSLYSATGRRVPSWKKIINWQTFDVFIVGYRRSEFGWLAAIREGDSFRNVGMIKFGVLPVHKQAFYSLCKQFETRSTKDFTYLEPVFRARIKTRNLTRNGMLRDAVFAEFLL